MLLFDNILFNSFIPQIVMVLMFLYSSLSMLFSNILEFQSNSILFQENSAVFEQTEYWTGNVPQKAIDFFSISQVDAVAELVDNDKKCYLPEITVAYCVKTVEKEQSNYRKFNFSRPPPFLF